MPETLCRLSLTIPEGLFDLYEQEAAEKEKTLNDVIIERLYACRHHHSSRGLYFNLVEGIPLPIEFPAVTHPTLNQIANV